MLSKELVKKIRHIEIKSKRLVDEIFSGEYRSNFKGKGMEFEDIREYYQGDDVRNIDWNVTARHNQTYVKQFREERELNIYMMVDISKSNDFGKKKDMIAEISATIAFSASRNNDRVGMILFTDEVEKYMPSKKGKKHVLAIIDSILSTTPQSKTTNIKRTLEYYNKIIKGRSILFLISDFMDDGYEETINKMSKKHEIIMLRIIDPIEDKLPGGAIFTFKDLETGKYVTIDNKKSDINIAPDRSLNKKNMITIYTHEDYVKKLRVFFSKRGIG